MKWTLMVLAGLLGGWAASTIGRRDGIELAYQDGTVVDSIGVACLLAETPPPAAWP